MLYAWLTSAYTLSGDSSQNTMGGRAPECRVGGNNKDSVEKLGAWTKSEETEPPRPRTATVHTPQYMDMATHMINSNYVTS